MITSQSIERYCGGMGTPLRLFLTNTYTSIFNKYIHEYTRISTYTNRCYLVFLFFEADLVLRRTQFGTDLPFLSFIPYAS